MADLETVLRLEHELVPHFDKNWYKLQNEDKGEQCVQAMIQYMQTVGSVQGRMESFNFASEAEQRAEERKYIFFLKRFTKVGRNVVKASTKLDDHLETLYVFNITGYEAASNAVALQSSELTAANWTKLGSHFLADAGDNQRRKFKILTNPDQLPQKCEAGIKWYESAHKAADMLQTVDTEGAATFYSFSGDAAREMFWLTREARFGERAFDDYMTSASWNHVRNHGHSVRTYEHAGKIAREMLATAASVQERLKWADRVYSSNSAVADDRGVDIESRVRANGHAGDGARVRYELTQDKGWAVDALGRYKSVLDHYKSAAQTPSWLNKIPGYVSVLEARTQDIGTK